MVAKAAPLYELKINEIKLQEKDSLETTIEFDKFTFAVQVAPTEKNSLIETVKPT